MVLKAILALVNCAVSANAVKMAQEVTILIEIQKDDTQHDRIRPSRTGS